LWIFHFVSTSFSADVPREYQGLSGTIKAAAARNEPAVKHGKTLSAAFSPVVVETSIMFLSVANEG